VLGIRANHKTPGRDSARLIPGTRSQLPNLAKIVIRKIRFDLDRRVTNLLTGRSSLVDDVTRRKRMPMPRSDLRLDPRARAG